MENLLGYENTEELNFFDNSFKNKKGEILITLGDRFQKVKKSENKKHFILITADNIILIDNKLNIISKTTEKFDDIGSFEDGFILFFKNDYQGFLNKDLEIIYKTNEYDSIGNFYDGLANFKKIIDNKEIYGFLDKNFKIVWEQELSNCGYFSGGLCLITDINGIEKFINKNFEVLWENISKTKKNKAKYSSISSASENGYIICSNYFYDKESKRNLADITILDGHSGFKKVWKSEKGKYMRINKFKNGFARYGKKHNYQKYTILGYINENFEEVGEEWIE